MQTGDKVFLKFSPQHTGTITRIGNGRFRVTWNGREYDDRGRPKPRKRLWYNADALKTGMQIGVPS